MGRRRIPGLAGVVIQLQENNNTPEEEPAIVGTCNMAIEVEVSNLKQQITDITNGLKRLDRNVNVADAEIAIFAGALKKITDVISDMAQKIEQIEKDKIAQFKDNDVYEVNKRIERLEAKVALINSNLINNSVVRFCLRFFND